VGGNMSTAMTEIRKWAVGLAFWEQVALDKIISGKQLKDSDYSELLQILLEDSKLADKQIIRPTLTLYGDLEDKTQPAPLKRLSRIENLKNVNALVSGQMLTFSPSMTAIYGGNGSGKSGYARVLANAGFTRGDREVLPNITKPIDDGQKLSADVILLDDGTEKKIHFLLGSSCPDLQSFYVFDSTSVRVHMNDANQLSFSPAGLSFLTDLANVTDEVRLRLNAIISEYTQPANFVGLFQGNSSVSQVLMNLGARTDQEQLKLLSRLSPDEKKRLGEINIKIANAELDKFQAHIEELRSKLRALTVFRDQLIEAQTYLNKDKIGELQATIQTYHDRVKVSQSVSSVSFKSETLDHVGTNVWHNFVAAAKALADAEGEVDKPYPQADSRCLLCQQPLSADAYSLIQRLWGYLESETQELVHASIGEINEKKKLLQKLALFDLSVDFSTPYKYIKEQSLDLEKKIALSVQTLRERRDTIVSALESKALPDVEFSTIPDVSELEKAIENIGTELSRLQSVSLAEEIERLNFEKLELEHRETLGQILPQVLEYIRRLAWAEDAKKIGGSTARITKFHNQLFASLVTDRYIELFEENLKSLGRPLKVKVQTKGKKGDTLKQIILVADESAKSIAKPEKVLSEGEKRAVALADFLTEVSLDAFSSGIILDDPVTSLDLDWREAIAKVLVDQAVHHQVIVFTHDLPFLYYLTEFAEEASIDTQTHWVKRGDMDDLPGYTFVNNSPALEKNYKKASIAKEWHEKSKTASASEQEKCLKEGFGALRTSYEAFIIFELFNEVVMRFSERISFGRLDGIFWDEKIAQTVIKKCETLSRYIEGHLHSDLFAGVKPTPDVLLQEIDDFEKVLKEIKALKKDKKK
jgi:ABC-type uncharacterized transport system ATPase subunit